MKRVMKVVSAVLVVVALVTALFGAGFVLNVAEAQGPIPTTPAPSSGLDQSFWQALATRLGTTVERLQQAVKDAGKDTVAQGLADGRLSQAQADRMNQQLDQWQPGQGGPLGLPFGRGGGRGGHGPRGGGVLGGQSTLNAVAQALGVTATDLVTELRAGRTLADVAQAKGVDQNTVKQAIITAKKAEVDAAQQAGRLTAEQATQMKQRIDQESATLDLNNLFQGKGGLKPGGAPRTAPGTTPQSPTTPTAPTRPSGA
jgi:hypothetical protein